MISDGLSCKKVLIVLDDVDHLNQLKALAGSHNWFGDGSRIIVTTRDQSLLTAHKVDVIHKIILLEEDEAINLFRKLSPKDYRPKEDYERLSKDVVSYAGGLPLALNVLGYHLCNKDIDEWTNELAKLKEIPIDDIGGKLKISYDALTKEVKELFLDIACFFRREKKDRAMEMLDACGFRPIIGVKVLIQKALIVITDGKFDMHDLVQEMAYHIVRGGHPNNPEKHSRVWENEDVLKICAMDATTELDMIEAIRYEYSWDNTLQHLPPIVANMKNLRWIKWEGDFATHLLRNFPQETLCCLMLNGSLQEQLWEGYKLLPNMKIMELWCLENLIKTPDISGLVNLERFTLRGCLNLKEIHPSIGLLERLVLLRIKECRRLKTCPPITRPKKLETLSFKGCGELFNLSEIQQLNMVNLHSHLDNRGKEVASCIESSTNFFVICWRCGCVNLPGVECCLEEPSSPHNMNPCLCDNKMNRIGLRFFLEGLRDLNISFCNLGDEETASAVWELPNLKTLDLSRNKFSRLSFNLLRLPQLKWLNVSDCKSLVELSGLPSSIAVVEADGCWLLKRFGDISNCKWLWNVSLEGVNKLVGDSLLDSMLEGNASEYYFINIRLYTEIATRFVGRLFSGRTFTLRLPGGDWYHDFCGFLICIVVTEIVDPDIKIVIKQEVDQDSLFELWQESNEVVEPKYDETAVSYVGYVSFGSLRNTTFSNTLYTMISVSLEGESYVGVELVPRKSKGDEPQTTKVPTDSSEFWDDGRQEFKIQDDSKSSIKILWQPWLGWV